MTTDVVSGCVIGYLDKIVHYSLYACFTERNKSFFPLDTSPQRVYTMSMNNTQQQAAYEALRIASERMGANNYGAQVRAHQEAGRKASTFRFTVTPEHDMVVKAMPLVLTGKLSADDAMSMLHEYDVLKQRIGR